MAEKLLKAKKRNISKNVVGGTRSVASAASPRKVVLVGTYAGDQLKTWPGYYPYPLYGDDKIDAASAKKVNEIWLFKGTKEAKYFAAECLGVKTRDDLKALGYPAKGKGHGDGTYLLFKIEKTYAPANASAALAASVESVIIRTKDFAKRSPKVAKQLKAYLESPDRKDAALANQLPTIVTKLPPQVLRVCEAAVQMDFLTALDCTVTSAMHRKFPDKKDGRLTCLDFFAGSGLVSEGLSKDFQTVWANDISPKKALVFNANNADGILHVCPIENVSGIALPSVDLSWGSFPCQDLSLAGDIGGIYASRSGLFWQWLRVMDEMNAPPPIVVAENVVGLVSADGGRYYVAAHEELARRGYRVGAVMLDALHWVPQSRKRIFVIGVRSDIDLSGLVSDRPTWCHPNPVIKVASLVKAWVWWKIPKPKVCQADLDVVVDFQCPCDDDVESANKLALVPSTKLDELRRLSQGCRRVFTGYRRTRNHKQVLEVRTDGIAGCLRTPCGGSSRQIIVIADHGKLSTRLLTVRETARLMGAPDSYQIPGSYNDGYMAMGDAVAVPVVRFLSGQLLAPLAMRTKSTM